MSLDIQFAARAPGASLIMFGIGGSNLDVSRGGRDARYRGWIDRRESDLSSAIGRLPEAKRRGYKQLLDAYEADRGKARGEGDQ